MPGGRIWSVRLPARKPDCASIARRSITWLMALRSAMLFLKRPREVLNARYDVLSKES